MAKYKVTTEDGAYLVTTEDAPAAAPTATPTAAPAADESWSLGGAASQFASGAVEGIASLATLAASVPLIPNKISTALVNKIWGQQTIPDPEAPLQKGLQQLHDILPEEDPNYRYSRTIGEFAGPTMAGGLLGMVSKMAKAPAVAKTVAKTLGMDVVGGSGAQLAEDAVPDSPIAPLLGALFATGGTSAAMNLGGATKDVAKTLWQTARGTKPDKLMQEAGAALRQLTELDAGTIDKAIRNMPEDELAQYMTLAEVTGSARASQLEKSLAGSGEAADYYVNIGKLREQARQDILNRGTTTKAISKETLGEEVVDAATARNEAAEELTTQMFESIDPNTPVVVPKELIKDVLGTVAKKQAGDPISPGVNRLVQQFAKVAKKEDDAPTLFNAFGKPIEKAAAGESDQILTSGALQQIRSSALTRLRDAKKSSYDNVVLAKLEKSALEAMDKGLPGPEASQWKVARALHQKRMEEYGKGTVGYKLTKGDVDPEKITKAVIGGTAKDARELKVAIGGNPALLEDVKRGVLDSLKLDVQKELTPNKVDAFISSKEGLIKELFGDDYLDDVKVVWRDLASQDNVFRMATKASKGGSPTKQLTESEKTMAGALVRGLGNTVLWRIEPNSAFAAKAAQSLAGFAQEAKMKIVMDTLFRASMDPKFASALAKLPTPKNMKSFSDRFGDVLSTSIEQTAKAYNAQQVPESKKKAMNKPDSSPASDTQAQSSTSTAPGGISSAGLDLIKKHESLKLSTYKDPGGVNTIGYGHTGEKAKPAAKITEKEAEELLKRDVSSAEDAVQTLVKVPLTQSQYDALTSFVFNVGRGQFAKSTLLKKLNAGDVEGAAAEFKRWNKDNGRELLGLSRRRDAESKLFTADV